MIFLPFFFSSRIFFERNGKRKRKRTKEKRGVKERKRKRKREKERELRRKWGKEREREMSSEGGIKEDRGKRLLDLIRGSVKNLLSTTSKKIAVLFLFFLFLFFSFFFLSFLSLSFSFSLDDSVLFFRRERKRLKVFCMIIVLNLITFVCV